MRVAAWERRSRNWRGSSRETRCEDIPEPVRRHARLVLLDTLGVILAGGERPEVAALRERLAASAGSGATVYARGWPGNDPRTAALLNGIAGRAIELCEGLRLVSGQAAMQVLPAVLAVGEQAAAPGSEMLAAFILGYDVVGRLPAGLRRARWRIRTARCHCSPPRRPGRSCAGSTPPGSAGRCASPRRCC